MTSSAEEPSLSGSDPPRSNHSTTVRVSTPSKMPVKTDADGRSDEIARNLLRAAQLAFVFELELAGDRRQRRIHVGDARHDDVLALRERAALGVGDDELERRDRQPLADARPLVDLAIRARLEGDLLDHLAHVVGDLDLERAGRARSTLPAW